MPRGSFFLGKVMLEQENQLLNMRFIWHFLASINCLTINAKLNYHRGKGRSVTLKVNKNYKRYNKRLFDTTSRFGLFISGSCHRQVFT